MRSKTILWVALISGVLLLAWPLSQAAGDVGYVKTVIGVCGLVILVTAWTRGKSLENAAVDIGMSLVRSPRAKHRPDVVGTSTLFAPPKQPPYSEQPPEPTPPHKPSLPPERKRGVFLYRKPRSEGDVTKIGTSWIGGLPALGQVPWPRDTNGTLMHHVMQIDLLEAGPFLDVPGLPKAGSLAVFCALGGKDTTFETKLCLVPSPDGETPPPEELEPIGDHTTGGHFIRGEDPDTLGTLPRWAVDLVSVETSGDLDALEDEVSAISPLGTGMNIGVRGFAASLPNGAKPSYWHSAQIFARSFEQAVTLESAVKTFTGMAAKTEAKLRKFQVEGFPKLADPQRMQDGIERSNSKVARLRAAKPQLERLACEMVEWAFAHGPWDVMSETDVAQMEAYFETVSNKESDAHLCYQSSANHHYSLESIASTTLKAMVTGPDKVFRLLPAKVQSAVDEQFQTPGLPHQLFGPPACIQDTAYGFKADHLLVQIVHDDLIGLRLGDAGHIQVWISPDELAKGNLGAAVSTFECH